MAILHKAKTYSEHLEKTSVDEKDIALAIKMNKQSIAKPPSKKVFFLKPSWYFITNLLIWMFYFQLIKELAEEINSKPLPQIRPHAGLRLPSEQHCMLEERVQMKHVSVTISYNLPGYISSQIIKLRMGMDRHTRG